MGTALLENGTIIYHKSRLLPGETILATSRAKRGSCSWVTRFGLRQVVMRRQRRSGLYPSFIPLATKYSTSA